MQIKYYHCNKGCFTDNKFCMVCKVQQQKLTFCGVNAHFQNGIAEQAICDLSEGAKKQLLQRWPQAVSMALWPYALCHAAYLDNVLLTLEGGQLKQFKFFSSI
jgi:hypothetical protein